MIYVVHDLNPEPWTAGSFARMKNGKTVVFKDEKVKAYQNALKDCLPDAKPTAKPVYLRFAFWRNTTDGKPADVTNLQKSTEDALQKVLFKNDRQVIAVSSTLVEQSPTAPSGVFIEISEKPFDHWWPDQLPEEATRVEDLDHMRRADFEPEDVF